MSTAQSTESTPETSEAPQAVYRPEADLYADEERFVWVVDLPGITEEQVDLEIAQGKLVLDAAQPELSLRYQRRFELPEEADLSKVDATLKHGQLRIEVQKRSELKPRKISIATH